MKEIVVISGKGGTGKTSLVAAFAFLGAPQVLVDCDVDAADLHLALRPDILETHPFSGGKKARILPEACTDCGTCRTHCRFGAIRRNISHTVDPIACEGCGLCERVCPAGAVVFEPVVNGEWYRSRTLWGPMIHAKLGPAESNSGKLVAVIREEARKTAESEALDLILNDGPPGIGCPVIASLAGASLVLVVTEPSPSGEHDLLRVEELARPFGMPLWVCMNRWDLAPDVADRIERKAEQRGMTLAGRIRYDPVVTKAQIAGKTLFEFTDRPIAQEVRALWERILDVP